MDLYLVTADRYTYDQYDAFIVWADSEETALKLAKDKADDYYGPAQHWTASVWSAPDAPVIVLGSFNAG